MSGAARPALPLRLVLALGWLGSWLGVAGLAAWVAAPSAAWIALAATGTCASVLHGAGRRGLARSGAAVLLLAAVASAFHAHHRVDRLLDDWDTYWSEREEEVGSLLGLRLERRQAAAETAVDLLAEKALDPTDQLDVAYVRDLRQRQGVAALALYDARGRLIVWDGVHWGKVPDDVSAGVLRHTYHDRPLFGYLYVTALTEDGGVAVSADLLRADLPQTLEAGIEDFASSFRDDVGESIRITQEDPGTAEGVWDLALPDRRLMSVVVAQPSPEERAAEVLDGWRRRVAGAALLAWLLLAVGSVRGPATTAAAAASLAVLGATLPVGELTGAAGLFEQGLFRLPGPVPVSLGRILLLVLVGWSVTAVLPRPGRRLSPLLAGALAAAAFPLALAWLRLGIGPDFLSGGRAGWIAYELTAAGILGLVTVGALAVSRPDPRVRGRRLAAILVALAAGSGAAVWVYLASAVPPAWWVLWGVPVGLLASAVRGGRGPRDRVLAWGAALTVAGSAAIPAAWADVVRVRMEEGADRLEGLTSRDDPVLATGLLRLAEAADSLDRMGREDVDILYHAWRASGLADEGRPVRLTMWLPDGFRGEELRAGTDGLLPGVLPTLLAEQRTIPEARLLRLNRDDARYVLTVPLSDGTVLSVVAPPFSEGPRPSSLDPFVRGARRAPEPTAFIPLLPGDPRDEEALHWVRAGWSWRAEVVLEFANDRAYHAHYSVDLPDPLQATARATLLLVLSVLAFGSFRLVGRALLGELGRPSVPLGFAISFRGRVTWALFGFFTLANALFGTVAYRTVTQASHRSARVIAERVVDDAAGWYRALGRGIERLSRQVGADLLEYRDGELVEGSVPELVELGLYEGWTPWDVHEAITGFEGLGRFDETRIGRWEYVTAFRRLPDGAILAAQVPLQAGTAAIQSTDLVELLAFVVLLGAGLSLGLAMLAGRALTRPIHALQVASERVGSGNLDLRLPEDRADEFGAVFRAFNRMVQRVRRARRQLVRTSRRTQLIMDEAAVGMMALDPDGRITLVNPRARELLGAAVTVGEPLRPGSPLGDELAAWLEDYLRQNAERADLELAHDEQRVRVRARRLGTGSTGKGAVVALDDVTDELRAERVLAWGEMARQVAHEVKNPLTPIKLSIQHVRRAWEDGRPDFEDILLRNATAMLREIDRLADIARGFSRFGAPPEVGLPLAPVQIDRLVDDVMTLYGSSVAAVRFRQDVAPDLPPVVAREAELREVLVNLLENARAASPRGSTVEVRACRRDAHTVRIEVVDEGSGIPEDVLPRIFEPQFSTRSTGTGLGLAIVRRLVRSWGATIDVRSEEGIGTTAVVDVRAWSGEEGGPTGSEAGSFPS